MNLFKAFLLWTFLSSFSLFAQEENWYEFELGDLKASFPSEEVYSLDTISGGLRVRQIFYQNGGATLMLQRTKAESEHIEKELSALPHNKESLIAYYKSVVKGVKNSMQFDRVDQKEIDYKNLVGYTANYFKEDTELAMESKLLLAGKDLIVISCYNLGAIESNTKEQFFTSLDISGLQNFDQFTGSSKAFRQGYAIGNLVTYVLLAVGIFFLIKNLSSKQKKPNQRTN